MLTVTGLNGLTGSQTYSVKDFATNEDLKSKFEVVVGNKSYDELQTYVFFGNVPISVRYKNNLEVNAYTTVKVYLDSYEFEISP